MNVETTQLNTMFKPESNITFNNSAAKILNKMFDTKINIVFNNPIDAKHRIEETGVRPTSGQQGAGLTRRLLRVSA